MQKLRSFPNPMTFSQVIENGQIFWIPSNNPEIKLLAWQVQSYVDESVGFIRNYEKTSYYDEF